MTPGFLPTKTVVARADSWNSVPTYPAKLRKKSVDPKICGWIGGLAEIPALCSGDSICVRDTENKYVGCCENARSCSVGIYTSCLDRNSVGWSPPQGPIQYNGVYTCGGNSECYRNTYEDGYHQYGCGMSSWATQVETTYSGQPSDVSLNLIYVAVTLSGILSGFSSTSQATSIDGSSSISSLSPADASLTNSIPLTLSIISPTSTTENLNSPPTSASTPSSNVPPIAINLRPGAIAGIIIGVVNGIAILAAIAFWICRRRRIKRLSNDCPQMRTKSEAQSRQSGPLERIPPISPLPTQIFTPTNLREPLPPYTYTDAAPAAPEPTSPQQTFFIAATETDDFSCRFSGVASQVDHGADADADADTQSDEHDPEIGIAISSDRQSLLRPGTRISPGDDTYQSSGMKSKSSRRSRSGASETDEDSMVSPISDEDDVSLTTSIRPAMHPWRGNDARYHLVDQVINEST